MNTELVPAAVAAGGGAALAASVYMYERRREDEMRRGRVRLRLRFPLGLEVKAAEAALSALSGLPDRSEVVVEVAATSEGIGHALLLPSGGLKSSVAALSAAMPGLRTSKTKEAPEGPATYAVGYFVPTPVVLTTEAPEAATHALLAGLAGLHKDEAVVVRWALRVSSAPAWTPRGDRPSAEQRYIGRAWQQKRAGAGFRVTGLVLARASHPARARELAGHITRTVQARSTGHRLKATADRGGGRSLGSLPRTGRTSGWLTVPELLPLLGWPLGPEMAPGVEVGASRELRVPRSVAREGRRLFIGRDMRGSRPVALSPEAARHHVAVVGPSGVGKSVLLARSILDDIAAGYGGAVIDPKADLTANVLDRVPEGDADRVVVLDPSAKGKAIGVNVFGSGDSELRADVLVGAMQTLFRDSWGIRSELYVRLALRTLAEVPGATLVDVARLFADAGFRHQAVGRVADPFFRAQWQTYEALSPAEQAQHVQAPLAKLAALIGRPSLRAVLASPEPKLDVGTLLRERKWLIVPLAPGSLGEPASRLLGAMLLYVIWSAIEARVTMSESHRRPVFLYIDELATLAALPFGLELLAERARGLGAGLTVAAQTLGRLPDSMRAALLGNVGSLVTFRAGAEEANRLARELPGLKARDLQSLGRFEVAARVGTGLGNGAAIVTGHTEPLLPRTGQAAGIRRRSLERYGIEPQEPAAETPAEEPQGRPGRTRRRS